MSGSNHENWKEAEISLPYWKQGDDLALYIEECDSLEEALEWHAHNMDLAAKQLRGIREAIRGHEVFITGSTHMIWIEGESEVIDRLVRDELAYYPEYVDVD